VYLFFVMPYMGLCKVVFKMVYCTLTLRIIRSVYINHFETTTNPDYMRGHNQKKDTHTLDFDVTLAFFHPLLLFLFQCDILCGLTRVDMVPSSC